jgi:hypothetical protein
MRLVLREVSLSDVGRHALQGIELGAPLGEALADQLGERRRFLQHLHKRGLTQH